MMIFHWSLGNGHPYTPRSECGRAERILPEEQLDLALYKIAPKMRFVKKHAPENSGGVF